MENRCSWVYFGTGKCTMLFLLLFIFTFLMNCISVRLGDLWYDDHKPKCRCSIEELACQVSDELHSFQRKNPNQSLVLLPYAVRNIHRVLVKGSGDEGDNFDEAARARALRALGIGVETSTKSKKSKMLVIFLAMLAFFVVLAMGNIIAGVEGTDPWVSLQTFETTSFENLYLTPTLLCPAHSRKQ